MNIVSLRAHFNLLFNFNYLVKLILNNTQRLLSFDTDLTQLKESKMNCVRKTGISCNAQVRVFNWRSFTKSFNKKSDVD